MRRNKIHLNTFVGGLVLKSKLMGKNSIILNCNRLFSFFILNRQQDKYNTKLLAGFVNAD